jgi:mannosyltransferase
MSDKRFYSLLAILTLIGLIIRAYHLAQYGFWLDEILTIQKSTVTLSQILSTPTHTNPPSVFLLLHFWIQLFGKGEVATRMLSVIFGSLCVFLTGLVGSSLYDRRTGLLAALFSAIMVFPIHYSREVRNYAIFLFSTLGSFYFFLKLLQVEVRKRNILGYLLFTFVSGYSHNYFVFSLLAQNLFLFFFFIKEKKILFRWIGIQLLFLLLAMPWLVILFQKTKGIIEEGFWIPRMPVTAAVQNLEIFVAHLVPFWLTLMCFLPCGIALVRISSTADVNPSPAQLGSVQATVLILLWLLCPILVPLLISQFTSPIYYFRFTIAATPALYLLMSRGIWKLPHRIWRIAFVLFIVVVAAWSIFNYFSPEQWAKHDDIFMRRKWREFAPELVQKTRRGDILFLSPSRNVRLYNFYVNSRDRIPLLWVADDRPKNEVVKYLRRELKSKKRVWVVQVSGSLTEQERTVLDFLNQNFVKRNVRFLAKPTFATRVMRYDVRKAKKARARQTRETKFISIRLSALL